jgi:branched-chain amino acid transport system permease protein
LLLAAASIAGVGAILAIELTHHLMAKSADGTVMRLFGVSLDVAAAGPWLVAATLAAVGAALTRSAWPMAARTLNDAMAAAQAEGRS